jgi:hypothetical protein
MASGQHTKQLTIQRAKEGSDILRKRIGSLEELRRALVGPPEAEYKVILQEIRKTTEEMNKEINTIFGSLFNKDYKTASESVKNIEAIRNLSGSQRAKSIENRIAAAKDIIERCISILQEQISQLENPVSDNSTQIITPKSVPSGENSRPAEPKEPILIVKPSLWGITLNVNALLQRIRDRLK